MGLIPICATLVPVLKRVHLGHPIPKQESLHEEY